MKKKQGGKRKNSGANPKYGEKGESRKPIWINVPSKDHAELTELCRERIDKFYTGKNGER